jgi:acyl-coenzyme A thioesterase PaaI-like protein
VSDAFYEPLGEDRFRSTPHTRGPWDPAFQHAGPPAALLGRALERCQPREGFVLARTTFEIVRPVPVADVEVQARVVRPGRSVELLEGELTAAGEPVMSVRAWRVKATTAPSIDRDAPPPPRPEHATPPPRELDSFGYGRAVELRFAAGGWWELRPATVWTRLRVALVAGEEPTGVQRVLAVADSANGVSAVLSLNEWLFINTELTVHFRRPPRGDWICLDAETSIAAGGAGLARSVLSDDEGVVAQGAQALLVAPR